MYKIEFTPGASKFLENLARRHKNICDRIKENIDRLSTEPLMGKPLMGDLSGFRSLRVGDYRILYVVVAKKILIQIVKIGHRREIYR